MVHNNGNMGLGEDTRISVKVDADREFVDPNANRMSSTVVPRSSAQIYAASSF